LHLFTKRAVNARQEIDAECPLLPEGGFMSSTSTFAAGSVSGHQFEPIAAQRLFLLYVGFTTLILATFAPSVASWFVLDDQVWIDPVSLPDLAGFFVGNWGHGFAYRPLCRVSFAIDQYLWGLQPLGWHVHSLLIHAANTSWIFLISRTVTKDNALSLLAALLFAVCVTGHENINWISGRTHLLGGFFYLGALYGFVRGLLPPCTDASRRLSYAFFFLGLLTYEAVFSLPLLLPFALWITGAGAGRIRDVRFVARRIAPYLVISALVFAWRFWALHGSLGATNSHRDSVVVGALQNLVRLFDVTQSRNPIAVISWVGAVVISIRRREWALPLSVVAAAIAIYTPFLRVDGVATRFLYLAQIPLVVAPATYTLHRLRRLAPHGRRAASLFCIVVVGLSVWESHEIAGEWGIAGDIAKSIPEQTRELYPEPPQDAAFIFSNIPSSYKRGGLFFTYFERAVGRQYPNRDLLVLNDQLIERNPVLIAEVDERDKYFRYSDDTRRIREITRREWLELDSTAVLLGAVALDSE
jgi:hypothetical protein